MTATKVTKLDAEFNWYVGDYRDYQLFWNTRDNEYRFTSKSGVTYTAKSRSEIEAKARQLNPNWLQRFLNWIG